MSAGGLAYTDESYQGLALLWSRIEAFQDRHFRTIAALVSSFWKSRPTKMFEELISPPSFHVGPPMTESNPALFGY